MSSTARARTTSRSGEKEKPTSPKSKNADKKRPPHIRAVFKTKAKAKSLFNQLDTTKRKRLTREEFLSGLKSIFEKENVEISELGLEMLWEQMAKDETGKCSWSEFASRFVADPTNQFPLAEKPKTEEEIKAEQAPKKIASTDFKKIQESLFMTLNKWHYVNVDFGLSADAKSYSKKELRNAILTLFAAERYEADYLGRAPETWSVYMSLNDTDFEKLFSFVSWTKKGSAKVDGFLPALERIVPNAKRQAPDSGALEELSRIPGMVGAEARNPANRSSLDGLDSSRLLNETGSPGESPSVNGLSVTLVSSEDESTLSPAASVLLNALQSGALPMPPDNTTASSLADAPEFKSVPVDQLGNWALEHIFKTLDGISWIQSLRTMKQAPFQGPLLIFPPLVHWSSPTYDSYLKRAVLSIDDDQVAQGSLILLSDSVFVSAVKMLPVSTSDNTLDFVYVLYVQFLYVCQVTKPKDDALSTEAEDETSVVQWMMRAKLFVSSDERPLHLLLEDSAVSVNTERFSVVTSKSFSDWDFQSIEFSLVE